MKKHASRRICCQSLLIFFVVWLSWASLALADWSEKKEYLPPGDRGPIVILLSGADGTNAYTGYAAEMARLGYYAVLLDGRDVSLLQDKDAELKFKSIISEAQKSPNAHAGKIAVIGFSRGGGGALANAAHRSDLVSAVITYYPEITNWANQMQSFAAQFKVPILVLAGEQDRYFNCCLVEYMRDMEVAAKKAGVQFELVVYPNAKHGFNIAANPTYMPGDAADAWQRTKEMLHKYMPVP